VLVKAGGQSRNRKDLAKSAAEVPAEAQRSIPCVMLIEPRFLVRDCIAHCLRLADPGFAVLEYSSIHDVDPREGAAAIALVITSLSTDQEIPDLAAEVNRAQGQLPNVPVVVVAESDELASVREIIGLGVRGYIPTSFDFAMFKEAIQFVGAGGTFVPASALLQHDDEQTSDIDKPYNLVMHGSNEVTHENWNETQERGVATNFTPRELAVISRLRDGKSNKLIARELALQEGTVKLHVRRIMKKMGVANRTQAALLATNMQLAEQR
jgi:DNA-binding NarL/FixJ family response regulator